jgi:two-component system OmpR family sensor kinase
MLPSPASRARAGCDSAPVRGRVVNRLRGPWPLRARLTVAVTAVTAVVLAVTAVLVFGEFARGLDSRTDLELQERADALTKLARDVPQRRLLGVSGEPLAQLYGPGGDLRDSTRALGRVPLLTPAEGRSARVKSRRSTQGTVAGTDDGARVLAFGVRGGAVVAIAEARDRREQELARVGAILTIGLPAALLLAAFTGYQVAGAALRPVERIREQAARIGEAEPGGRLPLPGTGDELDRLTSTLNDLLARLAGALEHERRIVSDASHELRTPISVLRTRLDVALRGHADAEALRAVVGEARDDVGRLARLADDLLVLARADQGRLPLRPEPIDVQDVLEQLSGRHETVAAQAGRPLRVTVDIDGGAVVLADPDRLAQALDNLVVNALSHGDGEVELVARAPDAGTVELSVADRGAGFPGDLLPRAFDRFAQSVDDGPGQGGAGLGLAIVAALAKALGGSARAANRPGGGAEVTVTVPAA